MIVKVRVTLSNRIAKVTGTLGIQAQMKKFTEGCYNPYNQVDNVWFDNYYVSTTIIYVLSKRKYKKLLKVLHTISYTY